MIKIFITKQESSDDDEYAEHIGHVELLDDGNAISDVFGFSNLQRTKYRWISPTNSVEFEDKQNDIKLTLKREENNWSVLIEIDSFRWKISHKRLITDKELNLEISKWIIDKAYFVG